MSLSTTILFFRTDTLRRGALMVFFAVACTQEQSITFGEGKAGDDCHSVSDCVAGLLCTDKRCVIIEGGGMDGPRRGDTCGGDDDCAPNWVCGSQNVCTDHKGNNSGEACGISVDCNPPLVCHGETGTCLPTATSSTGTLLRGESCIMGSDHCQAPLTCVAGAEGQTCRAGTLSLTESCEALTDCQRPLVCGIASPSPVCEKLPFFTGPNCQRSAEEGGVFRVYYEVPERNKLLHQFPCETPSDCGSGELCTNSICTLSGTDSTAGDEFYRLPFPNDIRRVVMHGANSHSANANSVNAATATVSMAGHARPGAVLGLDIGGAYFGGMETSINGFAPNAPIFFRLTDMPTPESICLDNKGIYPQLASSNASANTEGSTPTAGQSTATFCADAANSSVPLVPSVYLVNIDSASPEYNVHHPVELSMGAEGGQFICQNWLGIAPLAGVILRPDTIYAAVITTSLRNSLGELAAVDTDFNNIMLNRLSGHVDAAVLAATAPLRAWITDKGIDASALAAATVFTTATPVAVAKALHSEINSGGGAGFNVGNTVCVTGTENHICHTSVAGDVSRSCPAAVSSAYTEIHGSYQSPLFQGGIRPYLLPRMGGDIEVNDAGIPQRQPVDETLCYAATVPKAVTMPSGGWPLIIYAHGTGGNYRSFVGSSVAKTFNNLGFAVLGIDNIMHGPRQDPSLIPSGWDSSSWAVDEDGIGQRFFNVSNPKAARGNILQGSADLMYLTRMLSTPGGATDAPFTIDASRIYFFGHSQGTVVAPGFLAYEERLRGAILSGAGGELALSILNKSEPVDMAQVVGLVFGDHGLTRIHPMMGILAHLFAPADAIHYADLMTANPVAGRSSLPLMMFSGVGDSYTPDATHDALIRALQIPLVGVVERSIEGVSELAIEAFNNLGGGVSAGAIQLPTEGSDDGHFVIFNHPHVGSALSGFLSATEQKVVGQPVGQ